MDEVLIQIQKSWLRRIGALFPAIRFKTSCKSLMLSAVVIAPLYSGSVQATGQSWWNYWAHGSNQQQCISDQTDVQNHEWQPGLNQFNMLGEAIETSSSLQLTDGLHQASAVFWKQPIPLNYSDAEKRSFSSAFSFRISDSEGISDNDGPGGDGLTFIINASNQQVGSDGGGLGYSGMHNSVAVEFDTLDNGRFDRNDGNHVGINTGGRTRSREFLQVEGRFNDGELWHAWIDYEGNRQKLEVRLARTPLRPVDSLLSRKVRIPRWISGSQAYLGFTAGTGDAGNRHEVLSFQFVDAYAPIGECAPPEFVSTPLETATVGATYTYSALANDLTPGDRLSYQLLEAPAGMQIGQDSGQIIWIPIESQTGKHDIAIEVVDSVGLRDQQNFVITVEAASCSVDDLPSASYPHFENLTNWQLNGSAFQLTPNEHNVLRLTRDLTQSGSAFLKDAITLSNGQGGDTSFSANFGFRLTHPIGIINRCTARSEASAVALATVTYNVVWVSNSTPGTTVPWMTTTVTMSGSI
jgi:hypothetical protein